ncbi:MAG: ATP-binding protein [Myxococcota bacterium]
MAGLTGLVAVLSAVAAGRVWSVGFDGLGLLLFAAALCIIGAMLGLARTLSRDRGPVDRQRALLDALNDSVLVFDADGEMELENAAARELLGPGGGQLFFQDQEDLVDESGAPVPKESRAPVVALRAGRAVQDQIVGIRRPGHVCKWARVHAEPIPSGEEAPDGVVVTLTDLTQARAASKRIAWSEQKFRELLNTTREGVVIHRGFQMLYANGAFESAFGQGVDAWAKLFSEDRRELFAGRFRDALETGVTARYRREEVNSKGQRTWVDMLTRRMDWEGRPALQSNLLDVTDRVHAEAAAEAQKTAEAEARNKSQMLANMSHELRTPMTGVLGMADLLLQTQLDTQQYRLLTGLRSSADLLLTLVDDVLDFSRLEADVVRLDSVDFDPRRAVETVFQLLESKSRQKGIELRRLVDDGVPQVLRGDPVRLQQILFNLVGNAIKFTEQGSVEVRMSAELNEDQARLHVEVEDTGVGIASERLPKLFERWDQGDDGTQARFGGNGLGLAISRRLAHMMEGDISVRSVRGQGSTFAVSLHLPVGDVAAVGAPKTPLVPLGWARGRTLLLAEDEPINRTMLTLLMEAEGFRVTSVENGAQALQAAEREAYDLIVLDMHMPVMDGAEAATAIKALPAHFARARLIGLTADAAADHRGRYQSVGIEALLTKPFERNEFAWLAQRLLEPRPKLEDEPALVSSERLQHLLTHLGQRRLDQFAEQFRSRVRDEVGTLEQALLGAEQGALGEACHRLAGFAANFGADQLAAQARAIGHQPSAEERNLALDRLQRCLEATLDEMDRKLTQPRHERQ